MVNTTEPIRFGSQIQREFLEIESRYRKLGVSDEDFDQCFKKVFQSQRRLRRIAASLFRLLYYAFCLVVIITSIDFVVSNHTPTKRFCSRYVQDWIYPFMRLIRLATLPLVKHINIRDLYTKSCLVQNPFYWEPEIDCWPCEGVRFVVDLSGTTNFTDSYYQSGTPFVVKDALANNISFDHLREVFSQHEPIFHQGTYAFQSSNATLRTLSNFFKLSHDEALASVVHADWEIDGAAAVRVLRKLFGRPYFIPREAEVSLQRYLFFDSSLAASYELPVTDYANVWLMQTSGHRLIVLIPSFQCKHNCHTLSFLLQAKDTLFYNLQYWRPWSYSVNTSEDLSITFMGSAY